MRRDPRRHNFLLLGATAMLVAVGYGLGALVRPYEALYRFDQRRYERLYAETMRNDPPLGTRVELPTRDVFGQGLDLANSHVLVVFEGICTGCTLHPRLHALPFERFDRVLVVYESPADSVRATMEPGRARYHPRLSIVADPEAWFITSLNLWPTRWAVVQNGSLTRLQQGPEDVNF